ncbi:MAG: hypothetical protein HPY85_17125 [Anaerolineae bacterium]|jgi:hypothetical protein|nr:hypothetical protein [Anaerolineae bacterium]
MPPASLPTAPNPSLADEIALVRRLLQRVKALSDSEDYGLDDLLKLLNSVSLAGSRMARLLHTEAQLTKKEDLTEMLNRTLAQLLDEMDSER